ncbi:MAG: hypothetical protein GY909_17975 [Oligoflexia bacterium]|nr:hypothetical protein [Oligoflexia bacterium]
MHSLFFFFLLSLSIMLQANDKVMASKVIEAALSGKSKSSSIIEGKIIFYNKKGIPQSGGRASLSLILNNKVISKIRVSHDGKFKLVASLKRDKYILKVNRQKCSDPKEVNLNASSIYGPYYFKCYE